MTEMRVLLAEDHKIVRQGTRLYLESMGVEIVGEATDGCEGVGVARDLHPDVVIMDRITSYNVCYTKLLRYMTVPVSGKVAAPTTGPGKPELSA